MTKTKTSITHELALKLKNAGFPRIYNWERYEINSELLPRPTLSELIESCGDILLYKIPKDNEWDSSVKDVWVAGKVGTYLCADDYFIDDNTNGETGLTPEEAVANLYLALNKHQHTWLVNPNFNEKGIQHDCINCGESKIEKFND